MGIRKTLISFGIIMLLIACANMCKACSMYKITIDGITIVGCNEDAWRSTPRIWFENAKSENDFGACFTGSRKVKQNQFAPQSGMNEVGLTFSRLAAHYPQRNTPTKDKTQITNEVVYLADILHKCASIEDVKRYVEQYDHSVFIDDVFMYIDKDGKYLIVEPYELIEGDDPNYVLSNFCPSITSKEEARVLERYKHGEEFLDNHKANASLSFTTALSDTMHVCRNRNGDGTLLTSIWDTNGGNVNLFFYHDYDTTVQFNLAKELAKGDHMFDVARLFPVNPHFERLLSYKTPFNTPLLRFLLVILGGVLTMLSIVFVAKIIRNSREAFSIKVLGVLALMNVVLTSYFFVLATNINIYYFDAPYKHMSSTFLSVTSYIPFVLVLAIIPCMIYGFQLTKNSKLNPMILSLLIGNGLIYIASILGFGYWGLFDVWN